MLTLFDESMWIGQKAVIDPKKTSFWVSDFPIPRKTTLWEGVPTRLHFQPEAIAQIPSPSSSFVYPELISIKESPSFHEWGEMIAQFKRSHLEKVVFARKTSLLFKEAISPIALFHHLKEKSPNAFVFAVILSDHLAFVGATPEKLFSRKGLKIETEALAGTKKAVDSELLLHSPKDLKEFLYVKETLTDQLQKICNPFSISQKIFIKKAGNVSHLHYPFSVELKEAMTDSSLIQFLHPTPAIGGRPRDLALNLIHNVEPFDRGLYSGTVGTLSQEESHVYVGIRSCLIEGKNLHIFTGAGIVPESDPFFEWEELNHKRGLIYDRY